MSMLLVMFLALGILFAIINIHIGILLFKRLGGWQYGVANWGMSILLTVIVASKFMDHI